MSTVKTYLCAVLCVIVGPALLASAPAFAVPTVTVGIYDNQPLVFMDRSGTPRGIFVDLLEYVAEKEKWELRYVHGTWAECLERLDSGDIDLLVAIAYTPERARKYNYSYETVLTNWGQVFVQKDSGITSVLELENKKVAVKMEDVHFYGLRELTAKFNIECRFIEADEYNTVFELIEANMVQAGVVNRLFGVQNKANYQVKETPIMFNPIEVRYAAPKRASKDLLSAIDSHLRRMKTEKDSLYVRTLNSWLVAPTAEPVLPDSIKYVLAGIGIVLLVVVIMNFVLRYQVSTRTKALSAANENLTEQIRIREKAEAGLRNYERIVATSTDHMAIIDLDFTYRAINDAALEAVGKTREAVIGRKTWEVLDDLLPRDQHKKRLRRAFSGEVVKYRAWMNFPVIGRRYMDIVYTPIAFSDNRVDGCVVNSRDITERHELEQKLEQAQKMEFMGTIAGGVAHDLNNILSGIVSYPDLLLMQLPEGSSLAKPIQTIKKSGEKAAVIVQDLLTLARRGVANKEPVNIDDLIALFLNSPECNKILSFHPNVRIETRLSEHPCRISGSPVHLSKTVMNLVSNAAEAMPDGGEIQITTRRQHFDSVMVGDTEMPEGEYVLLEVSDTGVGIPQEDLEKIFEPFYTKKVMGRSGTGLGLAVVWGTVMDHHGYIDVVNNDISGTTFRIYFPTSDGDTRAISNGSQGMKYQGHGETILIVDDVEEQREIGTYILSELGYSVTAVASGEAAIAYLRNQRVDLVILDMLMPPGIDGLTTYDEILKIRPGQKAILASGYAETERVKAALNHGVHQFVKKPYTIEDIGFAVKMALA